MPMQFDMIKRACTSCNKIVWAWFKSQEEFDTFKCYDCLEFAKYLDNIEINQRRD